MNQPKLIYKRRFSISRIHAPYINLKSFATAQFPIFKKATLLQKLGLVKSQTWQEILSNLEQGLSNFFELKESHLQQAKTIYDLIVQFKDRGGMIQLMDKATMKLESAQFVQGQISLVILASDLVLQEFEKKMPVIDKFAMVERIGE